MIFKSDYYKNKNGTAERKCKCGSWKQHWLNFSGEKWPEKCSVWGCNNTATLGAHVYSVASSTAEYIIPACDSCNKRSDEFQLSSFTKKVSANQSKTCNKQHK